MGVLRSVLLRASENGWLREHLPRLGLARRAVTRFMPGEDVDAAVAASEALRLAGASTVLTRLGENIADEAEAAAVAAHYLELQERLATARLDTHISIKPTQLGLDLGEHIARDHLLELARGADRTGGYVWLDMESSGYVDATLDLFRAARQVATNVGVCLQSYLYRTPDDLASLLPLAPAIRLVKGAYAEPATVAYPKKAAVDRAFFDLSEVLLREAAANRLARPGFGTHDSALIERIRRSAEALALEPAAYEFQLLYGIRRDEQARLVREGATLRVLISYGDAWYPWFMRRLAERPANLLFVLKNVAGR
jgi:proline dehydrogenase